jgi:hypothetical protein
MSILKYCIFVAFFFIIFTRSSYAQDAEPQTEKSVLDGIKLGGEWFVGYFNGKKDGVSKSEFAIKRGYITIIKEFNDKFSARLTQDISVDQEGDGIGDIELRIKYAYAKYQFNDLWIFSNPSLEFGVVHRPWLSFEQKINSFRVHGRMFFENVGLVSSADYGLYFESLLGGEISKDFQESISSSYPGKFGSLGIGIYNGGGYNKLEYNNSKNIEIRTTIRPLNKTLPGLQISYIGGYGTGNTVESPEYLLNAAYLSYENRRFTSTLTYYKGKGLQDGSAVDEFGNSLDQYGYSGFIEFKFPIVNINLFGRYDFFKQKIEDVSRNYSNYIVGLAYKLIETSRIIFAYDHIKISDSESTKSSILQTTLEVRF